MRIREAKESDVPALTDLYNYYIENTAITFDIVPFTIEERTEWFKHYNQNERHRLLIAENEYTLIGYASSSPFRPKEAYQTSVETSIYLLPNEFGSRIGSKLYSCLFESLSTVDVHRAYAGITVPNDASLAIHAKFGFIKTGIFKEVGRKFGSYHDVEWWEKKIK